MEISEPFYQFLDLISDIAIGFYNSNPLIKVMQINQESIGFKYSSMLNLIQDSNRVKLLKEAVAKSKKPNSTNSNNKVINNNVTIKSLKFVSMDQEELKHTLVFQMILLLVSLLTSLRGHRQQFSWYHL